MLKTRIIPKLLLQNGRTVKGTQFIDLRDTGNPVTNARIYDAQGADEIVFLDIDATKQNRGLLLDIIAKTAEEVFMPLGIGGGIRSVEDISSLLKAGADKVIINTAAVDDLDFIEKSSKMFGSQCIVVSIDFRHLDGNDEVITHGGTKSRGIDVISHAKRVVDRGAGELLLTSIDRDGSFEGYDVDLIKQVSSLVDVPVIASGGAGNLQHLVDAVVVGNASAVAVGSLFHFTDQSPIKARSFMRVAGINVRA